MSCPSTFFSFLWMNITHFLHCNMLGSTFSFGMCFSVAFCYAMVGNFTVQFRRDTALEVLALPHKCNNQMWGITLWMPLLHTFPACCLLLLLEWVDNFFDIIVLVCIKPAVLPEAYVSYWCSYVLVLGATYFNCFCKYECGQCIATLASHAWHWC